MTWYQSVCSKRNCRSVQSSFEVVFMLTALLSRSFINIPFFFLFTTQFHLLKNSACGYLKRIQRNRSFPHCSCTKWLRLLTRWIQQQRYCFAVFDMYCTAGDLLKVSRFVASSHGAGGIGWFSSWFVWVQKALKHAQRGRNTRVHDGERDRL